MPPLAKRQRKEELMPYDEDTKVFDVAKPSQAQPDSTARPVIVGHRPQMSDPMVRGQAAQNTTPIHVAMDDEEPHTVDDHQPVADAPAEPVEHLDILPAGLEESEE